MPILFAFVNFAAKEAKPAKSRRPALEVQPAGQNQEFHRQTQEDSNLNSDFENYLVVNPTKYEWQNWMFVRRRRIGVVSTFAGRLQRDLNSNWNERKTNVDLILISNQPKIYNKDFFDEYRYPLIRLIPN